MDHWIQQHLRSPSEDGGSLCPALSPQTSFPAALCAHSQHRRRLQPLQTATGLGGPARWWPHGGPGGGGCHKSCFTLWVPLPWESACGHAGPAAWERGAHKARGPDRPRSMGAFSPSSPSPPAVPRSQVRAPSLFTFFKINHFGGEFLASEQ